MGSCLHKDIVPAEPELAPVGRQEYRDAMARLGAAVNVVTTDGPGGRHGFTASAVCSVTDDPPTLLVCLNRGSSASATIHANGVLCVNTLAAGQQELSDRFGGKVPPAERFHAGEWRPGITGAPVLVGALASFDCRITRFVEVGTHDVLFCEVVGLDEAGSRQGLMYFLRGYHALGKPTTE